MAEPSMEERIGVLERQVAELQAALRGGGGGGGGPPAKDWRRTVGMFAGDEVMKQIDEEARKFREADRQSQKARRRRAARATAVRAKRRSSWTATTSPCSATRSGRSSTRPPI